MREFISIVENAMKDGREFTLRHFDDNYDGLTCTTVLAEIDGKEIGYATYDCDGGFVRTVEVDPAYRRQGVATALYDYIEDLGHSVKPSPSVEPDGWAFWNARRKRLGENYTQHHIHSVAAEFGSIDGSSWSFDPEFPLDDIPNAGERAFWYEQQFSRTPPPSKEPVVLFHGEDGEVYVWDGNHRLGWAVLQGQTTIPAFVGRNQLPEK